MRHFCLFTSIALLFLLCFISINTVESSSTGGTGDSGVMSTDTVSSTTGSTVWNVNFVGAFAVGDRVQITWTMDANDSMTGFITDVNSAALTITVLVDTISGPTGILWSPWAFTLISTPSSTASASSGVNMPSVGSSSAFAASSVALPSLSSSNTDLTSNTNALSASSSTGVNGYAGVIASNNRSSTMGITVWNVTFIGAFAVGDRVKVTWTMDATDNMQGIITALDTTLSTITVNVDTISGPTGIVWSPWVFSLISAGNAPISSTGSPPTNPNPYNGAFHQYHEQPLMVALMMASSIMFAMVSLSF